MEIYRWAIGRKNRKFLYHGDDCFWEEEQERWGRRGISVSCTYYDGIFTRKRDSCDVARNYGRKERKY